MVIFGSELMKKKLKYLACFFETNPLQRPHSGDLILKIQDAGCDSVKSYGKLPLTS
jgi:hypothetical protein